MYSRMQHKEQSNIAAKISKKFTPGKVYTKGEWKKYTEIITTPTSRYSDAVVVVSSEDNTLSDVNFTDANFGVG